MNPIWYKWRGDVASAAAMPGYERGYIPANALSALTWDYEHPPLPVPTKRRAFYPTFAHAISRVHPWVEDFLTPYQKSGVAAVLTMPGGSGHFWWSAGSGKTLGAILWGLADTAPIITITKGAVKHQWAAEIQRFVPNVEPLVLESMDGTEIPAGTAWIVVNYEILPAWVAALERFAKHTTPFSIIFDESQKVKSHKRWAAEASESGGTSFKLKGNIAAAAMRLSKIAGRRLATTATPVKDRPRDLWAQLDLIHPRSWGRYWDFAKRYCGALKGEYGMIDTGKSNEAELSRRLPYVVHRVKHSEANANLPPKRRLVVRVTEREQVRAVDVSTMIREAGARGGTALLEARLLEAAARKRRALVERVAISVTENGKVIVFTGRRRDATDIRDALVKRLENVTVFHGDGEVSPKDREETRKAYMHHPGPCVLVGTTDAWGEGLNLHDTDLLLVGLLPYTPGQIIQLEGRVARLGQNRPVLIEYLIAEGTVDEHVAGILIGKLPIVERMIESDEVSGLARELGGLDDPGLRTRFAEKILRGAIE